jgi:hypothetical protein
VTKKQAKPGHGHGGKKTQAFPKELFFLIPLLAFGLFIMRPGAFPGYGVGQRAPEIKGVIQDGSTVRLSDFRKKVVFLDFWGDW